MNLPMKSVKRPMFLGADCLSEVRNHAVVLPECSPSKGLCGVRSSGPWLFASTSVRYACILETLMASNPLSWNLMVESPRTIQRVNHGRFGVRVTPH